MTLLQTIVGPLKHEDFSWWTVPFAFLLALFPRICFTFLGPGGNYFNTLNPRVHALYIRRAVELDPITRGRIERSEYALNNAIENLPLFAVAVLAANVNELEVETRNILSLLYIIFRLTYTWVYIWGQDYYSIPLFTRTVVWLSANITLGYLYLLPGPPSINELEAKHSFWLTRTIKLPHNPALEGLVQ
ncbi:hypothetical protein F4811DRAFT_513133 [Daldinia bambusicola]|nr:hypothetical protein F4811DRAFT_513133 [Daldinia bambusicola]